MSGSLGRIFGAVVVAAMFPAPSVAQPPQLPLATGVWVGAATACSTASNVFVHVNGRFGSVYFYGPGKALGPVDETEPLARIARGQDGYTVVNEGPLEVRSHADGTASVRAYSPSEGAMWTEAIRRCPAATLSPKVRAALARMGLGEGASRR